MRKLRPRRKHREGDDAPSSSRVETAPDDKLAGLKPLHVDPDDDSPTREDKEQEKAARRGGGSGGGPPIL